MCVLWGATTCIRVPQDHHLLRSDPAITRPRSQALFAVPPGYKPLFQLGRGAQSLVYECECTGRPHPHEKVAIRQLPLHSCADVRNAYRELKVLYHLQPCRRIVQAIECCRQPEGLSLVMELIPSTLLNAIKSGAIRRLYAVQLIALQILQGVRYMHQLNIAHRDLKPTSILVTEDCAVKICNFGQANAGTTPPPCDAASTAPPLLSHCGWPWRAPEVLIGRACTTQIDVFAVGVILGEMLQALGHTKSELQVISTQELLLFPVGRAHVRASRASLLEHLRLVFGLIGTPTDEQLQDVGAPAETKGMLQALQPRAAQYAGFFERICTRGFEACAPEGETQEDWARLTDEARRLMLRLMDFSPKRRCTAAEALEHAFLVCDAPDEVRSVATPAEPFDASFEDCSDDAIAALLDEAAPASTPLRSAAVAPSAGGTGPLDGSRGE